MVEMRERMQRGATIDTISNLWRWALAAMLTVFYISNIYDYSISAQLFYIKWLMIFPVLFLSWGMKQRRDATPWLGLSPLPIVLISFTAFASVLTAPDINESAIVFVSLLLAFSAAYSIASSICRAGREREFFDSIALVGRFVIVSAAGMWVLGLSLGRGGERFSAWTDNPNTLALMLAPTLIILTADLLSKRRNPIWTLPFLVIGSLLLLVTGSRAGMLWVLAAGLAFYSFRRGVGVSLLLGIAVLIFALEFGDHLFYSMLNMITGRGAPEGVDVLSGRSEVWQLGIELFAEKPMFGHGIGTSQSLIEPYEGMFVTHQGLHFHNSYLTIAVEMGLAGLLATLFALIVAVGRGVGRASLTQRLPSWPQHALPWAMVTGALAHACFETWLMSAGNANMIIIWTCILLMQARRSGTRQIYQSSVGMLRNGQKYGRG